MDFATALREQVEKRPRLGLKGRRVLAVLEMKPSRRRTRILARWEQAAAALVDAEPGKVGAIDWSAIDWTKLFNLIIELLLMFLKK